MDLTAPFHLSFSFSTRQDAVNAVVGLHEKGGVGAVTMAAVAKHLGIARSSVHEAHGGRVGFYESVAELFASRWRDWCLEVADDERWPVKMPEGDCETAGVLTWQSLWAICSAEARAGRPAAWKAFVETRVRERYFLTDCIARATGSRPPEATIDLLMILADGLRLRMVDPVEPLSLEGARELLALVWPDGLLT